MSWEQITAVIVALLTTSGVVLAAYFTHLSKRVETKDTKEARQEEKDFKMIDEMRKELTRAYARIENNLLEITKLEGLVDALEAQTDKHQDELKDALERNELLHEENKVLLNRVTELEIKLSELEGGVK